MMTDQHRSPARGPVELEVLRFQSTLGVIGALRKQQAPDFRVAQIIAEACAQQLREMTSSDGFIETIRQLVDPGDPKPTPDPHEAYASVLFPVFLASIRAGGEYAQPLGASLLVYSHLQYKTIAGNIADGPRSFEPALQPDLYESAISGIFVAYARALDRDAGVASWMFGHALVQWVTGITDAARRTQAAAEAARWFREQLQHWAVRIHNCLIPVEPLGDPSKWTDLLPEYIRITKAQIEALEVVRSTLGVPPSEFALHLAGHPESSRMAQRQVYLRIQEAFPVEPSELHLALLLRSRLLAAKLAGGDLFDLASRAPFDSDEVSEPELIVLLNALAERQLTSFDLLLAAIEMEERMLPQVEPSQRASAAVVRVTAILRGEV